MFLNTGFSYQWWNKQYGFEFGRDFYLDATLKAERISQMATLKAQRFPYLVQIDPALTDNGISCPNIDVEPFGHRFIPAMFGCKIKYSMDSTPWAEHSYWRDEEIMAQPLMTKEEFLSDERVRIVLKQAEEFRCLAGRASAQQNIGSVINTAIYLRGMDLFVDFYEKPEVIHKLYALITNMMKLSLTCFAEFDGRPSDMGIGNCSVCMLSPDIYERFNRQYDIEIMELARKNGVRFSLHQDSNMTPFIESYGAFDYLYSFDVGYDTDLATFRAAFPDVVMNLFVYSAYLSGNSPRQIRTGIGAMADACGNDALCGFSCYDIDCNTTDENVLAVYKALKDRM